MKKSIGRKILMSAFCFAFIFISLLLMFFAGKVSSDTPNGESVKTIIMVISVILLTFSALSMLIAISSFRKFHKENEYYIDVNNRLEEEKGQYAIIAALSGSYDLVSQIDLSDNSITLYKAEGAFSQGEEAGQHQITPQQFDDMLNSMLLPQDRNQFLKDVNQAAITAILKQNGHHTVDFRGLNNNSCEWYRIAFAMDPATEEKIVIGISNVEEEYKRKFAEQDKLKGMLEDEQQNLMLYHDILHSGMWSMAIDSLGNVLETKWSDEFRKMLGFSDINDFPDNIAAWTVRIHPDDKKQVIKVFYDFLRKAEPSDIDIDYRMRNKNGEYRWYNSKAKKRERLEENRENIIGSLIDITAEKQIEELLDEQRHRNEVLKVLSSEYNSVYYIDFTDNSVVPYAMDDNSKRVFNQVLENERSTAANRIFLAFVDKFVYIRDKKRLKEFFNLTMVKRKLKDNREISVVFRSLENNIPRFIEAKFVNPQATEGEPTSAVIAFANRDYEIAAAYVTDKICDEFDAVFLLDLDLDRFKSIRTSDKLFPGLKETGIFSIGVEHYFNSVSAQYRETWKKFCNIDFLKSYLADSDRKEYIFTINDDNNSWVRCLFKVAERSEGEANLVIIAFTIIDEASARELELNAKVAEQKRRLENQQILLEEAKHKAEIANDAKSRFLFNMSHDIRTPMNAIIGFTGIAERNLTNIEVVKDSLNKVEIASKHLLNLINDVLDMARIESGKVTIAEEPSDIYENCNEVEAMIKPLADAKSINFITETRNVKDNYVMCDKLHVDEILLNILSNAVKFTPYGGRISFICEQEMSLSDEYVNFKFTISDNGIGMSDEFLKHIFEDFTREQSSTVSGTEGTGLGMSIAMRLASLMNGHIEVSSKKDVGTTMILFISFKKSKVKPKAITVENTMSKINTESLAGRRVLLVEDNELNRVIAEALLEENGIIAESAENGSIAVEMLKNRAEGYFDAVLMDIQMPVMDGYEATTQIRHLDGEYFKNLPIIAMTANAFDEDKVKALSVGMNAHIAKPIDVRAMLDTIKCFI